jgi:hypothetical protein
MAASAPGARELLAEALTGRANAFASAAAEPSSAVGAHNARLLLAHARSPAGAPDAALVRAELHPRGLARVAGALFGDAPGVPGGDAGDFAQPARCWLDAADFARFEEIRESRAPPRPASEAELERRFGVAELQRGEIAALLVALLKPHDKPFEPRAPNEPPEAGSLLFCDEAATFYGGGGIAVGGGGGGGGGGGIGAGVGHLAHRHIVSSPWAAAGGSAAAAAAAGDASGAGAGASGGRGVAFLRRAVLPAPTQRLLAATGFCAPLDLGEGLLVRARRRSHAPARAHTPLRAPPPSHRSPHTRAISLLLRSCRAASARTLFSASLTCDSGSLASPLPLQAAAVAAATAGAALFGRSCRRSAPTPTRSRGSRTGGAASSSTRARSSWRSL